MTQPDRPRLLRLVRAAAGPVDDLLAALEQWAGVDRGEPAAYLELGDGEIRGEFVLTSAHASQLAALLRTAASQRPDHHRPQGPGTERGRRPRPVTTQER